MFDIKKFPLEIEKLYFDLSITHFDTNVNTNRKNHYNSMQSD